MDKTLKKTIAFICPPLQGHVNPMAAIAHNIEKHVNGIKFIGVPDMGKLVKEFDFIPIGNKSFPHGSIKKITKKMTKRKGMRMGRVWQSKFVNKWSDVVCGELPSILEENNISFIICDQMEPAVALVADYLNIPFITVCNAMAVVMHLTLPPFFTSWDYKTTERRLKINDGFYTVANIILKRDTKVLERWRQKWNMPERTGMRRFFATSRVATLSQQTPSLEFPFTEINQDWHYCGPFRNDIHLSYKKPVLPNDDKKNVYISLGSLQGSRFGLLNKCVKACDKLDLRPIVVHAGLLKEKKIKKLQKKAVVYDYLKQPDVFNDCDILISHCGLNTALDALSCGRPIVAIPIGIEQGAIATKIKRNKCAVVVKRPSVKKIVGALSEIISNPEYEKNARALEQEIKDAGCVDKATNVIVNTIKEIEKGMNNSIEDEEKGEEITPALRLMD